MEKNELKRRNVVGERKFKSVEAGRGQRQEIEKSTWIEKLEDGRGIGKRKETEQVLRKRRIIERGRSFVLGIC